MTRCQVRVNLGTRSYDIQITSQELPQLGETVSHLSQGTKAFVVTDSNAATHAQVVASSLVSAGWNVAIQILCPGESQKCLKSASQLYDWLQAENSDRKSLVVPVGGGVVGDLAGFVAATYLRGLAMYMVPTTLLAMVDSAVGGKVGINHPLGKNLIGAFHQPIGVWIDTLTLATLPDREYRSGLAEVVKYGVILDAEFFEYIEVNAEAILCREPAVIREIIARCCQLKADVVTQDEKEVTGLRAKLNYGHTFAHAFETAGNYGEWLHGEAVAAGMMCAARLACRLGQIGPELVQRQQRLLARFELPIAPRKWPAEMLIQTMRADKKALAGKLRLILPRRLGEVDLFDDISEAEVCRVLDECHS